MFSFAEVFASVASGLQGLVVDGILGLISGILSGILPGLFPPA